MARKKKIATVEINGESYDIVPRPWNSDNLCIGCAFNYNGCNSDTHDICSEWDATLPKMTICVLKKTR